LSVANAGKAGEWNKMKQRVVLVEFLILLYEPGEASGAAVD